MCVESSRNSDNRITARVLHNPPRFENGLHAVSTHQGCATHPFASVFLLFTSTLVVSGVCVHVYVCLFDSQERRGTGVHQIIHQNKSMANSILHPECPVWPRMTREHTVHSTRGAGEERTEWVHTSRKRDWWLKLVQENEKSEWWAKQRWRDHWICFKGFTTVGQVRAC